MSKKPGILHRIFTGFWTLIDQGRRSVVNLLFLFIIVILVKTLFFTESAKVQSNSALVIKPYGYIVDELDYIEPIDGAIDELNDNTNRIAQTLLKDVLKAIDLGRTDSNISTLYLNLGSFYGAEPSKLQDIALAIQKFKTSGKVVYAYSEFFNQAQYYLAAQADEVYMDPIGTLYIEGYGRFNTYFKGAIDKLGISYHVFKVGTFKSAVEPFLRNDMSDAAKQANGHYLGDLWQSYTTDVAKARNLTSEDVSRYSNEFLANIGDSADQFSTLAISADLIDGLKTRQEMNSYLMDNIGSNFKNDDFIQINHLDYLNIVNPVAIVPSKSDKIAIVVAKGTIYNGNQKAGAIGGQSTAKLIRRARLDDSVKALVLRVDSPGGSAFASEIIRREVLKTKAAGKPVVVSMGSYAASGGYWISASADEIWASPTTITGSIGVFGMVPTFEKPLNKIGIFRDGVGTTKLSGAFDVGKALREDVSKAIQSSVEYTYNQFINIVAEGRNLKIEDVKEIAEGRVWSGKAALEHHLVDYLGGIDDAIASAADKASLVSYETLYIEQELTSSEQFLNDLFNSSIVTTFFTKTQSSTETSLRFYSPTLILMQQIQQSFQSLLRMNDPQNLYVHCLCNVE